MRSWSCLALSLLLVACGSSADPVTGGEPDAGVVTEPDAGAEPEPLTAIDLPQMIAGAMRANPVAQTSIPVHVAVTGDADRVTVAVDGAAYSAIDEDGDRTWTAAVPIGSLADGDHAVEVTATAADQPTLTAEALLRIGRTGAQLTDIDVDGNAGTPRLHRMDDELWLTWTDGMPLRSVWLRKLDGAGRWLGDRIPLVAGDRDILSARTAVGGGAIAILFQQPGGPYQNYLTVVDTSGAELVAPIALDPPDRYGSFGGDLVWDGDGFAVIWRINNGAGAGEIRWLRIDGTDYEVTGPVTVAASGDDDPDGGFLPHTFITVATAGDNSLVSFTRDRWHPVLELSLPTCQVARVDRTGAVLSTEPAATDMRWLFDHECRLFDASGGPVLVWSTDDLTNPNPNPPTSFQATRLTSDGTLDPNRAAGLQIVAAPMHRTEPFLRASGDRLELAWLDERSYEDPLGGRIELYSAALTDRMEATDELILPHARFISGTSQLRGAAAGTNTVLVWVDDRHGQGLVDPAPELFLDVVWR